MTYKAVTQRVMLTAIKNCLVDMLILFRLFIVSQGSVSPTVFTLYPGTEPVDSLLTSPVKAPLHGKVSHSTCPGELLDGPKSISTTHTEPLHTVHGVIKFIPKMKISSCKICLVKLSQGLLITFRMQHKFLPNVHFILD